jgi:hypothetical protein
MFTALSLLLVLVCVVPATAKLRAHPKMVASAGHFAIPWSRYRLIGVAELLAAAGVLVGLKWAPIGDAAASGMCVLLVGALTNHRQSGDGFLEAMPALVALAVDVAYLTVAIIR